jgi:mannose-1-phosphate guanylyltransferase
MLGNRQKPARTHLFERFSAHLSGKPYFYRHQRSLQGLVGEQLPELTDNQRLCEPSRNNTAPCVCYTALKLAALDPDANFVHRAKRFILFRQEQSLPLTIQTRLSTSQPETTHR